MNTYLYPPPVVWPLVFMLTFLVIYRQIHQDIRPIVRAVVTGVAANATGNALAYAIFFGFGLSASLGAFIEVFQSLDAKAFSALSWHQYATMWARVLNPFIVAGIAYVTKSKFTQNQPNETPTAPPAPRS